MCECLDYEDGDRYQCVMCADMDREREAENERLREALRASAPDAVREAAEHYVGTCAETNGGKMCPRCLAVVLGIAARDGGGE